ncbi:MAG: peptidylprolyl isomerase [Sedimentisphaerales bacterium]
MKTPSSSHVSRRSSLVFVMLLTAALGISQATAGSALTSGPNTVSTEPNKPAKAVANEPNAPAEPAADSVAVTVNGIDINESQIEAQLKPQIQKMGAQMPASFIEQYKKQLRQQFLEKMIIEQLLDEKVKAAKIAVTDEEVTKRIKEIASQQQPPLSVEDFKALIEAYGQSFDDVKHRIQKGLAYQKLMEAQWAGKIDIKEEDAKKYYSENKSKFEVPEQVRASHILITPDTKDPNADPNQAKAAAKAKAEDLLKQIKGGADFAELARANSACPSSKQGGDLGYGEKSDPNSNKKGTWVAPFEKAAFALKPGQVSDVVETQFGYHIIKVTDHNDANVIPFEQAKDDIIKMLTQTKQAEFAEKYVESLKADAKIVYPPGKEPNAPAASLVITAPPRPKPAPEPEKKKPDNKPASEPEKKNSVK